MPSYVALLRGINVGGRHALKMAVLREVIERAGGTGVATYIQSGNAVFVHPQRQVRALQADLVEKISTAAGFAVPVRVRTATEFTATLAHNPFPRAATSELHVMFCDAKPAASVFAAIDAASFLPERWGVVGREAYLWLPNGLGKSKLAVTLMRRPTLRDATTRNWRTIEALVAML